MRRFLCAIVIAIALPAVADQQVAIVAYHQVEPVPQLGWSVSIEDFTDQMRYVRAAGFRVVSIADAYDYLSGKRDSLPSNPVVLTFDDGFADTFTNARPVLKPFGFPWSVYIYPRYISYGSAAMKWDQVLQLSREGVDVESHTMSHPHLMRKSHPEMNDDAYAAWLHDELAQSKATIEQKTGKPVRFIAYPYGDWDQGVVDEAKRDGYLIGLLSWSGMNTRSTNLLQLRRFPMQSDTTLDAFARGIGALPIELRETQPANESVSSTTTVSAVIANPNELDPATIRIELLGENTTARFESATGRVTVTAPKLTRERQTVVVYGERASDHRPMTTAWTFYTSADAKKKYDAIAQRLRDLPLHHTDTKRK